MSGKSNESCEPYEIVTVRRRQARSVATRRKIIRAATKEFAEAGYDGVTTRSIAERAKVKHGLVVYHFKTKLETWHAVIEDVMAEFADDYMRRFEGLREADVVSRLRIMHGEFIRFTARRPEFAWLIVHESGAGSERIDWLVEKYVGPEIAITIDMIRQAQALGCYVEGDPAHLHYLFLGAATQIFLLPKVVERTVGRPPFDEAMVEQHVALCQRLFFRDPPAPANPKK